MCPLCIANIAVLATTSSGGVAALVLKRFCSRRQRKQKKQHNENNRTGIRSRSGVREGVGGCTPTASREREGIDSRPRRAGRGASADAVADHREGLHVRSEEHTSELQSHSDLV